MRYSLIPCLIGMLFGLAACGGGRAAEPPATPARTAPSPTAAPTVATAPLVDAELLNAPGVQAACDHPAAATLTCRDEMTHPLLNVAIDAGTFARWSLQWASAGDSGAVVERPPLTGIETLHLRVRQSGTVQPNLYVVERDGDRFAVGLAAYGLHEGWNDVYVPLAEIKDEEGHRPHFADVVAIQIVFEWADMAGELEIDSVRFESVWREAVGVPDAAGALAAALTVPAGFTVQPLADDLRNMTQIDFTPDGSMLVSMQGGRVWWYSDGDGDGAFDQRHLYTTGLEEVVGLLYDPSDGSVWLGGRGRLYRTVDKDGNGVAERYDLRVDGLPWGRHQNNGMAWNPDPDPFTGEPGGTWIYFGLGSTDDLEVGGTLNASILRFPKTEWGRDALEVVSRGNRNAYDVVWAPVPAAGTAAVADQGGGQDGEQHPAQDAPPDTAWQLFASENGPDFNDAPDEINHIRWQHHYGFPERFGVDPAGAGLEIDGMPYSGALYDVAPHASANGLAYVTNPTWPAAYRTLYMSLFGQVFSPDIVGHTVERITLIPVETETGELTYRGEPSDFIVGLERPLPLTTDRDSNLIVGDYATGVIYRVTYTGG